MSSVELLPPPLIILLNVSGHKEHREMPNCELFVPNWKTCYHFYIIFFHGDKLRPLQFLCSIKHDGQKVYSPILRSSKRDYEFISHGILDSKTEVKRPLVRPKRR
jgi:hypothetical protein